MRSRRETSATVPTALVSGLFIFGASFGKPVMCTVMWIPPAVGAGVGVGEKSGDDEPIGVGDGVGVGEGVGLGVGDEDADPDGDGDASTVNCSVHEKP